LNTIYDSQNLPLVLATTTITIILSSSLSNIHLGGSCESKLILFLDRAA
jgi:hypothetical protein